MADMNPFYAPLTTVTVTGLATLANGASATSNSIANNDYFDFVVTVTITTTAGALTTGTLDIYSSGSLNNVLYDDQNNDKWIGSITLGVAGVQTATRVVTVAPSWGGTVPPYSKIRFKNSTGAALGGAAVTYRGVMVQVI